MAWDDPSPRARTRNVAAPSSQPGYGPEPVSSGRLLWCALQAGLAGLMTAVATKAGLTAWHGHAARPSTFDLVLAAVVGIAVAALSWRYLRNRRGGGGWVSRLGPGGSLRDRYGDTTLRNVVAAEIVGDVISDVIDAATD